MVEEGGGFSVKWKDADQGIAELEDAIFISYWDT